MLLLLALTHALQVYSLRHHPQPILFGDAQSYYVVGQRFQRAAEIARGAGLGAAIEEVRGVLYFSAIGVVYGAIDALRPGDVPFAREVLAGFNTLAALGVFLLARRLSDSYACGLLALALASVYPPFSVQTGRLLPDPITGCLFVWSAWLFAEGVVRRRSALTAGAGLLLGAGLLVRSQLLVYTLWLLAASAAVTAAAWWRSAHGRRAVAALALGLLPAVAAWGAITAATGDDVSEIEALGNFTFQPRYPYGFWQFLESDGWMGPWRLEEEPYYRALEEAAGDRPALLESRSAQWLFTLGYVLRRPLESAGLVLDNAWRLYDRPANDYKRDYPFPYPAQVWLQRGLMLMALAGAAWLGRARPALLGALFVPATLGVLHALSYPWPRFNQPAMPIAIAAAAAGAFATARAVRALRPRALLPGATAGLCLALGLALRLSAPGPAWALRTAGVLGLLLLPFALLRRENGPRRTWPIAIAALLAACFSAHALRDRRWHEVATELAAVGRVEQEILLGDAALARLRQAPELFVVVDLHLPRGNPRGLSLEVAGRRLDASALIPTMPRFGESVDAGGRNRLEYPQWWAVRVDPAWLPGAAGALRVALESDGREPAWVGADRFRDQERVYEGPSFGDWPLRATIKLEYDGDYRLDVRLPLESDATRSLAGRDAERRPLRAVHRIRLLALEDRRGHLSWETAPREGTEPLAAGFFGYSGSRGEARLRAGDAASFDLPLVPEGAWQQRSGELTLCHRPGPPQGGMHHGGYLLTGLGAGAPLRLELTFLPGMSDEGMFFSLDRGAANADALAALARACEQPESQVIDGVARVLDAARNSHPDSTGRWRVAEVF